MAESKIHAADLEDGERGHEARQAGRLQKMENERK